MNKYNSISKEQACILLENLVSLLTECQREEFLQQLTIQAYDKNDVIYEEHNTPTDLICLLHGKVKIFRNGISGRPQIMRMISPFGLFGYRAYFAHEKYVTSAAAFERAIVARIPMDLINNWLSSNIKLCRFFLNLLSVDLGISDMRTVSLTQKHIRGRLAEALLDLRDKYGLESDGATLSIYLSREDLASLSNMTTSNAIRTLSSFSHEEIIATDGRKIKILKPERLMNISIYGA